MRFTTRALFAALSNRLRLDDNGQVRPTIDFGSSARSKDVDGIELIGSRAAMRSCKEAV